MAQEKQIWVTEEEHFKLKLIAVKRKITMRDLISEWIKKAEQKEVKENETKR